MYEYDPLNRKDYFVLCHTVNPHIEAPDNI